MQEKPSNPTPQSDEGSPGQKGTVSYGTGGGVEAGKKRDDNNTGGSSGSKGSQSYPVKGA